MNKCTKLYLVSQIVDATTFHHFDSLPSHLEPPTNKIAFVVANDEYTAPWQPLNNQSFVDASAVGNALEKLGYDVQNSRDQSQAELGALFRRIGYRCAHEENIQVLVYFAGYGRSDDEGNPMLIGTGNPSDAFMMKVISLSPLYDTNAIWYSLFCKNCWRSRSNSTSGLFWIAVGSKKAPIKPHSTLRLTSSDSQTFSTFLTALVRPRTRAVLESLPSLCWGLWHASVNSTHKKKMSTLSL